MIPIDLHTLKFVCRTWRDIINRILKINPFPWSILCYIKVPDFYFSKEQGGIDNFASGEAENIYVENFSEISNNRCFESLEVPESTDDGLKFSTTEITCMKVKGL